MNIFRRSISFFLILSLSIPVVPAPAFAALIGTEEVAPQASAQPARERINALLRRVDVQAELQKYGISADDARTRVAALMDEEVHKIGGKLDTLPAGGEIIGVLFTVFIVLLVTDILGFTKVFPFTRSVK